MSSNILHNNPTGSKRDEFGMFIDARQIRDDALQLVQYAEAILHTAPAALNEMDADSFVCLGCTIPDPPTPTEAERRQQIDKWYYRIAATLAKLARLYNFLDEARLLEPHQVDANQLLELEFDAQQDTEALSYELTAQEFSNMIEAVTGQKEYVVYLKWVIQNNSFDENGLALEIDSIGDSDPAAAAELRALLGVTQ